MSLFFETCQNNDVLLVSSIVNDITFIQQTLPSPLFDSLLATPLISPVFLKLFHSIHTIYKY